MRKAAVADEYINSIRATYFGKLRLRRLPLVLVLVLLLPMPAQLQGIRLRLSDACCIPWALVGVRRGSRQAARWDLRATIVF